MKVWVVILVLLPLLASGGKKKRTCPELKQLETTIAQRESEPTFQKFQEIKGAARDQAKDLIDEPEVQRWISREGARYGSPNWQSKLAAALSDYFALPVTTPSHMSRPMFFGSNAWQLTQSTYLDQFPTLTGKQAAALLKIHMIKQTQRRRRDAKFDLAVEAQERAKWVLYPSRRDREYQWGDLDLERTSEEVRSSRYLSYSGKHQPLKDGIYFETVYGSELPDSKTAGSLFDEAPPKQLIDDTERERIELRQLVRMAREKAFDSDENNHYEQLRDKARRLMKTETFKSWLASQPKYLRENTEFPLDSHFVARALKVAYIYQPISTRKAQSVVDTIQPLKERIDGTLPTVLKTFGIKRIPESDLPEVLDRFIAMKRDPIQNEIIEEGLFEDEEFLTIQLSHWAKKAGLDPRFGHRSTFDGMGCCRLACSGCPFAYPEKREAGEIRKRLK